MPHYRFTITGRRRGDPRTERTFQRYIQAPTAQAARASLAYKSRWGVHDLANGDGPAFDEWRVTSVRKVTRWEVITTDNTAWHSGGITGVTVFYSKRAAMTSLRRTQATRTPGQGVFLRKGQ